ncbi:hypothetical protein AG1IA_01591 [Rhizoctonia solani AG-1 IA]|uniref:Uncharacterized protein n=1 Tax=Thanatephorus cucumeris (strain AG1-IA) TaxID=983506 RepID=L8X6W2_THACA|nr:hypothetical protein AG1IA_01591 [Rhizoctonia solani AG-1 IA]
MKSWFATVHLNLMIVEATDKTVLIMIILIRVKIPPVTGEGSSASKRRNDVLAVLESCCGESAAMSAMRQVAFRKRLRDQAQKCTMADLLITTSSPLLEMLFLTIPMLVGLTKLAYENEKCVVEKSPHCNRCLGEETSLRVALQLNGKVGLGKAVGPRLMKLRARGQ